MISAWLVGIYSASIRGGLALLIAWLFCQIPLVPVVVRCWIWRAAYMVLLISFWWTKPLELPVLHAPRVAQQVEQFENTAPPQQVKVDQFSAVSNAAPFIPPPSSHFHWQTWVFEIWEVFLTAFAFRLVFGWAKAQRLRKGTSIDVPELGLLCRAMGIKRPPALKIHSAVRGPLLVGAWRPVIVLPESIVQSTELKLILAHELAHLKRRDLIWNWLPTLAMAMLPVHPLIWICNRHWHLYTESACDVEAMQVTAIEPAEYGRVLLKVATAHAWPQSGVLAVAVAAESRWLLKQRLSAMAHITQWDRRRLVLTSLMVGMLTIIAAVPWRAVAQQAPEQKAAGDKPTTTQNAPAMPMNLEFSGTVVVTTDVLRAPMAGKVAIIKAAVGDLVRRGDLVVQMDQSTARTELTEAEAKLSYATKELAAKKQLQEQGAGTTALEVGLAESQVQLAHGEVEQAMHALGETQILAPFDGIVAKCDVQPGDALDAHEATVTILKSGPAQIEFYLPQSLVGQVVPGTKISVNTGIGGQNHPVPGEVERVAPMLDPQTGMQKIAAQLKTVTPEVLPGMVVRVVANPSP